MSVCRFLLVALLCLQSERLPAQRISEDNHPDTLFARNSTVMSPVTENIRHGILSDSLSVLPMMYWSEPYGYVGAAPWFLHPGLNLQLSSSLSFGFGANRFPGALFSNQVTSVYAHPLTSRFSLMGGFFVDNHTWNGWHNTSFGLSAMASCRLNERVTLGVYGSKRLFPNHRMPFPVRQWPLYDYDHRVGGTIHVKCSDSFSFSVSLEERK